jgi:hypothetical protein
MYVLNRNKDLGLTGSCYILLLGPPLLPGKKTRQRPIKSTNTSEESEPIGAPAVRASSFHTTH